uniref:Uncharacterized protein n=1 Tax=Hyaloperonospora arabidopsidis (strain Emoy2) TaxID=559515 RepID=M4C4F8_HYAAE
MKMLVPSMSTSSSSVPNEANMYRGMFGSHVACVFCRLFRLGALYGSNLQDSVYLLLAK